ncbi:uncharacterized protein TNCV_1365211 [Trichonephila clavipes]|nr:uncharacterized protein TNCV_1365211 [Trichonephila clavipes]
MSFENSVISPLGYDVDSVPALSSPRSRKNPEGSELAKHGRQRSPKMMPARLYHQDFAKLLNCHYNDEVEKLANQLNEEAERTERPIRRLSKVMYRSTCTDMQVDVMGECLRSIKHVVGVRSVFLAKRLHAV